MDSTVNNGVQLQESDRAGVITIIDNYTDVLLDSTETVQRPPRAAGGHIADAPVAEHGFSILIKVFKDSETHTILLDTGLSKIGVPYNLKVFGIDLGEVEAVVISHGHMDHFGTLENILAARKGITVVLHPAAIAASRGARFRDGTIYEFPTLNEKALTEAGAKLVKSKDPYLMANGLIATTGEVERVTDFEKGSPSLWVERNGEILEDQVIDDQGVMINVAGKGLVVISGCAHAGIINMIRHAQRVTKIDKVYAVVGGFHLPSPYFQPIVDRTIQELKAIGPEIVVPMHCTGWDATTRIAQEMPSEFVLSSVGTTFVF